MQRYFIAVAVGVTMYVAASVTYAQTPPSCPTDVKAAINQACPCGGARNHGQYVKCIRRRVDKLNNGGCDKQATATVAHCAAASICGKPHSPIVCCTRRSRPKLLSADKCTAKGGTVATGATNICDAVCPTPVP